MGVQQHRFNEIQDCVEALAERIAHGVQSAVHARGVALLALSGGSTPAPLYRRLAALSLPWPQITLTLADERWVDRENTASNEHLVREALLLGGAGEARFVPLKNPEPTVAQGLATCERALAPLPTPFDYVILGMGEDGHTASLFPESPGLAEALNPKGRHRCCAMTAPSAPTQRMSLTLAALLDSREIVLLIQGEAKWRVFEQAESGTDMLAMPVRAVLQQQQVPVHVFWSR